LNKIPLSTRETGMGLASERGLLSFSIDRIGKLAVARYINWLQASSHAGLYETRFAFVWATRVSAVAIMCMAGISCGGASNARWCWIQGESK
jgi:hypothetical protein